MSHLHAWSQKDAKGRVARYRCTASCDPESFASDGKKRNEEAERKKAAQLAALKTKQDALKDDKK